MLRSSFVRPVIAYLIVVSAFVLARAAEVISTSDLITGLSVVIGSIPAVYLAVFQVRETQRENDRTRSAELRRNLEAEAFQTITAAVVQLTKALSDVGSIYSVAVVTLRAPEPNEHTFRELAYGYMPRVVAVYRAKSEFVFAVESYEIALLRYHHLRIFIQHRLDDIAARLQEFGSSTAAMAAGDWKSDPELERIRVASAEVAELFHTVQSYLLDYRIEVMNGLLGDLFDRKVPRRRPLLSSIKTLAEVATPQAVAAEDNRRIIDAVTGVSRDYGAA